MSIVSQEELEGRDFNMSIVADWGRHIGETSDAMLRLRARERHVGISRVLPALARAELARRKKLESD